MLHPDDLTAAGEHPAPMRPGMPTDEDAGATGTFQTRLGATLVWLLFLGLTLNIWPGWTRIAEWLH
jgi:hypothetical protein